MPETDTSAPIPPFPPTPSVINQPVNHGKPLLPVTAVAAILLISSLAFGAYQFGKNQTLSSPIAETPTVSPATESTADWKTYTDNEIGFTFKYPIDRRVQQSPRKDGKFITIEAAEPLELISIYISDDPTIVNNFGVKNSNGGPLSNLEKVQIDNRDGIKYRAKVNTETNQTAAVTIQVIKDKYSIELVYFQVNEQSDKTFNQILATFKLLNITATPTLAEGSPCNCSLAISSGTNVEFLVTSPSGQQTGYLSANNSYLQNIPTSSYGIQYGIKDPGGQTPTTPDMTDFEVSGGENGNYTLQVIGRQPGKYQLNVGVVFGPGNSKTASAEGILTASQVDRYTVAIPSGIINKVN